MIAKEVARAVRQYFGNYDYKLHNVYMYGWECDFFAISTSGYALEVEIKVSRSDFFADFKKESKHNFLAKHKNDFVVERQIINHNIYNGERYLDENGKLQYPKGSSIGIYNPAHKIPNKFYYACPEGLIQPHEVPFFAGLIYIDKSFAREVKKAPFLHKIKNDKTSELLSKYYHKNNNLPQKIWMLQQSLNQHLDDEGKDKLTNFIYDLYL